MPKWESSPKLGHATIKIYLLTAALKDMSLLQETEKGGLFLLHTFWENIRLQLLCRKVRQLRSGDPIGLIWLSDSKTLPDKDKVTIYCGRNIIIDDLCVVVRDRLHLSFGTLQRYASHNIIFQAEVARHSKTAWFGNLCGALELCPASAQILVNSLQHMPYCSTWIGLEKLY